VVNLDIEKKLQEAVSAHRQGNLKEAEGLYRIILNYVPNEPNASHNLGILAASTGRAKLALELFKNALNINPKISQYWMSYIDTLIKEKLLDDALKFYLDGKQKGFIGDGFNIMNLLLKSIKSNIDKDINHSIKAAEIIISIKSDSPRVWGILGSLRYQINDLTGAIEAMRNAHQQDPNNISYLINLGEYLRKDKQTNQAILTLKKAIKSDSKNINLWINLGVSYQQNNSLDQAKIAYEKGLNIDQKSIKILLNLALLSEELGEHNAAIGYNKRVINIDRKLSSPYINLGNILVKLGKTREAAENYRNAYLLEPNNPKYYHFKGVKEYLISQKSLTQREDIVAIIKDGKWNESKNILEKIYYQNPSIINKSREEFIELWCQYCLDLIIKKDIKKLINIFINLIEIGENNIKVNNLINSLFKNFEKDLLLELTTLEKDQYLIKLSYAQFNFQKESFSKSSILATEIIKEASCLVRDKHTSDFGWLLIRRSLRLFKDKNIARENLNQLIDILEN